MGKMLPTDANRMSHGERLDACCERSTAKDQIAAQTRRTGGALQLARSWGSRRHARLTAYARAVVTASEHCRLQSAKSQLAAACIQFQCPVVPTGCGWRRKFEYESVAGETKDAQSVYKRNRLLYKSTCTFTEYGERTAARPPLPYRSRSKIPFHNASRMQTQN